MADLSEITEILKQRHRTGVYGMAHFRLLPSTWAALRAQSAPQPKRMPWEAAPLGDLLSIPIVLDEELEGDSWRLVDSTTGEVLRRG